MKRQEIENLRKPCKVYVGCWLALVGAFWLLCRSSWAILVIVISRYLFLPVFSFYLSYLAGRYLSSDQYAIGFSVLMGPLAALHKFVTQTIYQLIFNELHRASYPKFSEVVPVIVLSMLGLLFGWAWRKKNAPCSDPSDLDGGKL